MPFDDAARLDRLTGHGTVLHVQSDEILGIREGVNHFNAQAGEPGVHAPCA